MPPRAEGHNMSSETATSPSTTATTTTTSFATSPTNYRYYQIKQSSSSSSSLLEDGNTRKSTVPSRDNNNRKRVTFSSSPPQVKEIATIDNLKEEVELDQIWFSPTEYDDILKDCLATVERMESAQQQQEQQQQQSTSRGLERLTTWGIPVAKQNRFMALQAVLQEQYCQRTEGIHDVELLATQYFDKTCHCQVDAHKMGLYDRQQVLMDLWMEGTWTPPFIPTTIGSGAQLSPLSSTLSSML